MGSGPLLAVPPSCVRGGDFVIPGRSRDNGVVGVRHETRVGRICSFLVAGLRESGFGYSVVLRHENEMDDIINRCFDVARGID